METKTDYETKQDWRPNPGARVKVLAPHPRAGHTGVVTKWADFFGYMAIIVVLEGSGFPVGITGPDEIEIIGYQYGFSQS